MSGLTDEDILRFGQVLLPRQSPAQQSSTHSRREKIVLEGQIGDITEAVLKTIAIYEQQTPRLFLYGGLLMRLGIKKEIRNKITTERPALISVDANYLCTVMGLAADYYTKNNEPTHPSKRIAETILHWISVPEKQSVLPFQVLKGLVETPIVRADGSIFSTPGYDTDTGLYYVAPQGTRIPHVPDSPTDQEIADAKDLILEVICDLPFSTPSDQANMVALMLTPILREHINGVVPMALLDSPKWGTGKTLSAEVVAEIGTGEAAAVDDMPYSDEEMKKKITSMIVEGRTFIVFDNVVRPISSPNLARALTGKIWSDRLLSTNSTIKKPIEATMVATGNNIVVHGEMVRRCYRIRLNRQTSRPQDYNQFTHPELVQWLRGRRIDIVASLLTLTRAWHVAGRPLNTALPRNGNFDQWVEVIGGILHFVGIDGFLGNMSELENNDEESTQIETFLRVLWKKTTDTFYPTKELVALIRIDGDKPEVSRDFDGMLPVELESLFKKKSEFSIALGRFLAKYVDGWYGDEGFHIKRDTDKHTKQPTWKINAGVAVDAGVLEHLPEFFTENNSHTWQEYEENTGVGEEYTENSSQEIPMSVSTPPPTPAPPPIFTQKDMKRLVQAYELDMSLENIE